MSERLTAKALAGWRSILESLRDTVPQGEWEASDCFDPESHSCGLLQVRIPSRAAWDADGYQYLTIADMEWAAEEHMHIADFIAAAPAMASGLFAHIDALEAENKQMKAQVEAAEAKHAAFMDLFQTNFILATPPELDPEDIHEWFTQELKLSRAEFERTYRATATEES